MSRTKLNFRQKNFKITDMQQQKLDELLAQGSFATESDILRQALDLLHRKYSPPYLQPTINQEEKIEKVKKEKASRAIPDEQFVEENLEGVLIYKDLNEKKWLFYRKVGNYIDAFPLEQVKDWVHKKDFSYQWHNENEANQVMTYELWLTEQTQTAKSQRDRLRELGVALPDEV